MTTRRPRSALPRAPKWPKNRLRYRFIRRMSPKNGKTLDQAKFAFRRRAPFSLAQVQFNERSLSEGDRPKRPWARQMRCTEETPPPIVSATTRSAIEGSSLAMREGRPDHGCNGSKLASFMEKLRFVGWNCRTSVTDRSRPRLAWDVRVKRIGFSGVCAKLPQLFRYPRSEPDCAIWSFPGQIKLTFIANSSSRLQNN